MTVTVSAWFGVALVLSACFWLGVWARPRLATLRRRIGGSRGRAPVSGRGKAGTVERVLTYTGCSTAGQSRAGAAGPATHRAESKTTARTGSGFGSAGSPGAVKLQIIARDDFSYRILPNGDVLGWWYHGERGYEFAGRNTFTAKGATLGENQPLVRRLDAD